MSKKVVITGATGGLGRNLCNALLARGYQVLACGRNQAVGDCLKTRFRAFDLSVPDVFRQVILDSGFEDADVVCHCAALSAPWGRLDAFKKANVDATENVLAAMSSLAIPKLVHISTPSIYFDFVDRLDIREDFLATRFVNGYALSKYQAEKMIEASGVNAIILRPRGIFGEYDTALLPRLERVAQKGFLPLVCRNGGCGEALVDITYVGNVVHAIELAINRSFASTEVFNITNNQSLAIVDIYHKLIDFLGLKVKLKSVSYGVLDTLARGMEWAAKGGLNREPVLTRYGVGMVAFNQTLNLDRAQNLLAYQPIFSIEDGLSRYVQFSK